MIKIVIVPIDTEDSPQLQIAPTNQLAQGKTGLGSDVEQNAQERPKGSQQKTSPLKRVDGITQEGFIGRAYCYSSHAKSSKNLRKCVQWAYFHHAILVRCLSIRDLPSMGFLRLPFVRAYEIWPRQPLR